MKSSFIPADQVDRVWQLVRIEGQHADAALVQAAADYVALADQLKSERGIHVSEGYVRRTLTAGPDGSLTLVEDDTPPEGRELNGDVLKS